MITKSELYAMNLSTFTTVQTQLAASMRSNQDRRDAVSRAMGHVRAGWEGTSAEVALARLEELEQRIDRHIKDISSLKDAISKYCTAKQGLQVQVIDYVRQIEAEGLTVSDDWSITPHPRLIGTPAFFVALNTATAMQPVLSSLVNEFEQYDLQAPVGDL